MYGLVMDNTAGVLVIFLEFLDPPCPLLLHWFLIDRNRSGICRNPHLFVEGEGRILLGE